MNRKYSINGTVYEYDIDHISIRDALMIKVKTGLNLVPFSAGLGDLDPGCIQALAWVILTAAGAKGPAGEPVKLEDVDFDMLAFFVEEPEPDSEADPTPGEAPNGGVTPGSTSPEPSTSTPSL